VTEEELGSFATDEAIVRLTDGSGAYAMLAVYHGLHCVERMHHVLYTEHYYPNLTEAEAFLLKQHSGICYRKRIAREDGAPADRVLPRALFGLSQAVCPVQC
jgi:hypothetical protein